MNKSLLNIAVTMALSSAVFSGSVLSTQAYADELVPEDVVIESNNNSINNTSKTDVYTGMGVGAATGTLIAGPVGLIIGGIVGALVGSNQQQAPALDEAAEDDIIASTAQPELTGSKNIDTVAHMTENEAVDDTKSIHVAQLGSIDSVIEDDDNSQQEELMNILVSDLSLDVYFRSGSTDIEKFYPARLAAIADLVNTMDKLELHLDGYTDRRGNKEQNLALANERIEKVRQQLISAGVDENRIISKAFGEAKMKSSAGNLEAYTFDRRVVIRFERTDNTMSQSMATAFSTTESDQPTSAVNDTVISEQPVESISPVVADAATRF
jgi:sortase system peptidoglycan-associated protein